MRGVHHRYEDYVPFVSLKLCGCAAEQAMTFIQIGRKIRPQEAVDFEGLFLTHKGHYAKTGGQSDFVGLVFLLFKCRDYERGNDFRFFVVDLSFPCRAFDPISNDMRSETNPARIPQWFYVTVVRELVTELDDFGDTAEVFNQSDRFSEGLTGQIVD